MGLHGLFRGARHHGLLGSNKAWQSKGGALDLIIEHLAYGPIEDRFDLDNISPNQCHFHRNMLSRYKYKSNENALGSTYFVVG